MQQITATALPCHCSAVSSIRKAMDVGPPDLQALVAGMVAAGDAGARGKGRLIAHFAGLQHTCMCEPNLPSLGHQLISTVPHARAVRITVCTMRQTVSTVAGRLPAADFKECYYKIA